MRAVWWTFPARRLSPTLPRFTASWARPIGGLALVLGAATWPCSPEFPPAVVWQDTGDRLMTMPEVSFYWEMRARYTTGVDRGEQAVPPPQLDIERDEVLAALAGAPLSEDRKQAIASAYCDARRVMRRLENPKYPLDIYDGLIDPAQSHYNPPADAPPARFDFAVFAPVFQNLPREFGLYAEGAACYNLADFRRAAEIWKSLLDLPPEERPFRSVWAAYMLGKAMLRFDNAGAIPYFEETRRLADAGFSDPLSLAIDSLGWQARAEAIQGDYKTAIHRYDAQDKLIREGAWNHIPLSMQFVCSKIASLDAFPPDVIQDELCREIMTAWVVSNPASTDAGKRWTQAMMALGQEHPIAQAGQLARLYYNQGEMDLAAQWTEMATTEDAVAQWVQAKLLLRDGKLAEADAVLAKLDGAMRNGVLTLPKNLGWKDESGWHVPVPGIPGNDLGTVRLDEGNYAGAMEAFLQVGSVYDATYIADQVMTADELETFLKSHPGEFPAVVDNDDYVGSWQKFPTAALLRYILGRKLARQGQYERARPYYPEFLTTKVEGTYEEPVPLRELFDRYADADRRGHNKKLSKRKRAEGLFDQATLARKWGMELLGSEHAPDWRLFDGVYTGKRKTRVEAGAATPDEAARVAANAVEPFDRFHYRRIASALMWEAAELLPDDDEKTAQALWYGRRWSIPNGDADKFYQAMVRRCAKLPIGQETRDHWFVKKPDDWP